MLTVALSLNRVAMLVLFIGLAGKLAWWQNVAVGFFFFLGYGLVECGVTFEKKIDLKYLLSD